MKTCRSNSITRCVWVSWVSASSATFRSFSIIAEMSVITNTQGTDAVPMPQCTWCRRNERTMSSVKQLNFETKLRKLLMRSSETGGENGSMKLTQSQSEILFPNSNATFNCFPKLEGPGFAHQVGQRRSGFVCSAGFFGSSRTSGTLTAAYMHDSEMKDILFLKRW